MDADSMRVETDLFEHREVKPHFINPCCFGEDFAAWLTQQLSDLSATGYQFTDPVQEDFGWGIWATLGQDQYWIALSFCGDGPTEEPGEWSVSVTHESGANMIKRLFRKPQPEGLARLRERVWQVLRSTAGIRVLDDDDS